MTYIINFKKSIKLTAITQLVRTSQIHAFANKIQGGDFVLIPSGKGKAISVGYILAEVNEKPEIQNYLATRRVLWLIRNKDRKDFFFSGKRNICL